MAGPLASRPLTLFRFSRNARPKNLLGRLAISYDTLHVHRWQIAIVTAVVVVFAIMGVEYIYPGQQLGGLRGGGALKGVGAGWLILTLVDVSPRELRPNVPDGRADYKAFFLTWLEFFSPAHLDPLAHVRAWNVPLWFA